jgi:hypothetical protein
MGTKHNLNAFLLRCLLFALPVLLGFEVLFRLGFYPVVTNSLLFDDKMIRVQKQHIRAVKLLAIGSSSCLYDLSSRLMVQNFHLPYYNFSSWELQISDMRLLLAEMIKEYRPQYVLICSSPRDFRFAPNPMYQNYTDMPPLIRENFPELFYAKPYTSIHQVFFRKLKSYHQPIDAWGGALITMPKKNIHRETWDKYFPFPTAWTAGGYKDLDTLSAWLHDRNIQLIFAEMPLNMVFDNASEANRLLAAFQEKCRSMVTAHGGVYLNYHNPAIFADSLFFDQTHLQAAGAEVMTNQLVADLKKIIK